MKSRFLIPLAALLMSVAGCHQRSIVPDGSFRLTVTDVLSSQDERVAVVAVETTSSQKYSIRAKSVHLGDGLPMEKVPNNGLNRERVLTFVASRISPNGAEHDYIKATLKRGEQVLMTDAREFPHGTLLASKVALTIGDGVYPLCKQLVIGRLYGEDLLLTVGNSPIETAQK